MKLQRLLGAICAGLMLLSLPARAAEQASYVMPIAGPHTMADLTANSFNPAFRALASCSWGASAPANGPSGAALPYQCWANTTANPVVFSYYDGASWVAYGALDTSTHTWLPYLTGGVSGGVPYFSATNIMGSSAALALNGFVVGGGAGAAPATIAACTDDQIAFGRTSNSPLCRTVSGDITFAAGVSAIGSNKVTNSMLRQSGALAVVGRSANSTGNVADIQATAASDAVLRENGSAIGFGTVATGGLANNAVTDAKLRQGGALSLVGRSANSTGNVADISAAAASDCVFRESGSALACGTVATAGIVANAITFAKFQQIAALSMFGNCTNATANGAAVTGIADQVLRVNGAGTSCAFGAIDLSKAAAVTGTLQTAGVPAFAGGDVTGSGGSLVLTIAANVVSNAKMATMAAYTLKGNATGSSATPTDIDISALTAKASPISADIVLIQDSAASNAFKRTTVGAMSAAGSVASYEGRTGAVTAQASDRLNLYAAPFDAMAANNIALNADQAVSQENGGGAVTGVTATSRYITDQSVIEAAGIAVVTGQQVTDAPAGFAYSLKATLTTAMPSPGATDLVVMRQPIEGYRAQRLNLGTANAFQFSVGEWVKSNVAGTFYAFSLSSGSDRVYLAKTTLVANTWTWVPYTVPVITSGTFGASTAKALDIGWCLASGSSRQSGTTSGLLSGNFRSGTDQTNWASSLTGGSGSVAPTFQRTGLVVLPGTELPSSAASPLIMRPYAQELLGSRRYLHQSLNVVIRAETATSTYRPLSFPIEMRATPTITQTLGSSSSSSLNAAGNVNAQGYEASVTASSASNFVVFTYKADARL